MRSDLKAQRVERYKNRNKQIKVVKKLGQMRRDRALAFRDFQGNDFMDYDPTEWMD